MDDFIIRNRLYFGKNRYFADSFAMNILRVAAVPIIDVMHHVQTFYENSHVYFSYCEYLFVSFLCFVKNGILCVLGFSKGTPTKTRI